MNAKFAAFLTALLIPTLFAPGWARDRRAEPGRVLHDEAFKAIVAEASKSISTAIQQSEPR